jgi:pyruvate kinase
LNITKDEKELISLREKINQEMEKQAKTYETRIIAKLENEEAIKNLEGIMEHADVIMVARGMLGTILPIEKISWI